MKRIAIALLATAAGLAATSARADTRVHIGVNVGGPAYRPAPPAVVVAPPPAVVYSPAPVVVVPPRGYWKDVQIKTWVPERWVMSRDRWGRSVRVCEPGYYTYTTQRVWIDGDRDRHDNGYHRGHDRYSHDSRGGGWRR